MLEALQHMGLALLLTVALEAAAAWLLGLRTWRAQAALLLVNIATNPTLNALIAVLGYSGVYTFTNPFDPLIVMAECIVVVLEAWLLKITLTLPFQKTFVISLAVNCVSYLTGAFLLR